MCESAPDVPTKLTCTGDAVAGASLAAVSVTTTELFGLNEIWRGRSRYAGRQIIYGNRRSYR